MPARAHVSQGTLATVFEQSHDAILMIDPDADAILAANPRACDLLDRPYEELLDTPPSEIHPHEIPRLRQFLTTVTDEGTGFTDRLSCLRGDGEFVPAEISASMVDVDGEDCVLAFIRDVSRRRRYERGMRALNASTERLLAAEDGEAVAEEIVDIADEVLAEPMAAVWLRVGDGPRLIPAAATDIAEQFAVSATGDGIHPIGPGTVEMDAFRSGELTVVESYTDLDDVSHPSIPLETVVCVPLGEHGLLSTGSPERTVVDGWKRDLLSVLGRNAAVHLSRIEYERQLRERNERLEAFARTVSHDLRNPLSVAKGYTDLLEADDPDERGTARQRIVAAIDRMDELIDDVLALAHEGRDVGETTSVSLADLAGTCWATVATNSARLRVAEDCRFEADPERLRTLLENLFRNAVDHGTTSSRTGPDDTTGGLTVTVGPVVTDGRLVGFYVADDGVGIPETERDRVLDSGYTTAETGTGFGLAIVSRIAEAHGWSVTVTESETGGARFEFAGLETREVR